jgi:hypothetical protein
VSLLGVEVGLPPAAQGGGGHVAARWRMLHRCRERERKWRRCGGKEQPEGWSFFSFRDGVRNPSALWGKSEQHRARCGAALAGPTCQCTLL